MLGVSNDECNYAECHYAQCCYAECRGAARITFGKSVAVVA